MEKNNLWLWVDLGTHPGGGNKKKAGSIVVKILISVLFAYVYAAAAILKGILALFTLILRR